MSDYTYAAGLAAKDALPSGNAGKVISGAGLETEFVNIQTAIATKHDSADIGVTVQAYDAQLATLSGITAQQATDLASLSAFVGTVLNDADASAVLTTLGVSAFAKTILDDTSGEAIFATMGAAKDVVGDGYQKFPGGVIIQWGSAADPGDSTNTTITFPLTFPSACFVVIAVAHSGTVEAIVSITSFTTGGAVYDSALNSVPKNATYWIAIGN